MQCNLGSYIGFGRWIYRFSRRIPDLGERLRPSGSIKNWREQSLGLSKSDAEKSSAPKKQGTLRTRGIRFNLRPTNAGAMMLPITYLIAVTAIPTIKAGEGLRNLRDFRPMSMVSVASYERCEGRLSRLLRMFLRLKRRYLYRRRKSPLRQHTN